MPAQDNPFHRDEQRPHHHQRRYAGQATRIFAVFKEPDVVPYDLVIFDEAHKLSADRGTDLRVRKTDRYCLAEALAGVHRLDANAGRLGWSAHHLLLLTATPHMGKDYPYYALWRLLEPEVLSTPEAFDEFPPNSAGCISSAAPRRRWSTSTAGRSIRSASPTRSATTLTQGEVSEQTLYDETTDYLRFVYNRAKLLNRAAARLAMSVFQRRLASSTYALLRSFERRIEKLDDLIDEVQEGKITPEQLAHAPAAHSRGRRCSSTPRRPTKRPRRTAGRRTRWPKTSSARRRRRLAGRLLAEREQVKQLRDLAKKVYDAGARVEVRQAPRGPDRSKVRGEKFIIFTEHRDTLEFPRQRLGGMGYTGQIAQIHGGMDYTEREEQVERFRKPRRGRRRAVPDLHGRRGRRHQPPVLLDHDQL